MPFEPKEAAKLRAVPLLPRFNVYTQAAGRAFAPKNCIGTFPELRKKMVAFFGSYFSSSFLEACNLDKERHFLSKMALD